MGGRRPGEYTMHRYAFALASIAGLVPAGCAHRIDLWPAGTRSPRCSCRASQSGASGAGGRNGPQGAPGIVRFEAAGAP